MPSDLPSSRWLQRARWAAVIVALICCAVGLIWVYRSAMVGDVFGALAGAGLCLGIIALDLLAAAVLRLGSLTLRCARQLERLEARVTALELAADRAARAVDLVTDENFRAASLAAASLKRDTFPRLSTALDDDEEEDPGAGDRPPPAQTAAAEPIPELSDGQRELDRLVLRELNRLRDEFGRQVRDGDYAGAMRTGQRIATLFPDSTLAREFESIREPLQRRASAAHQQQTDERASAV